MKAGARCSVRAPVHARAVPSTEGSVCRHGPLPHQLPPDFPPASPLALPNLGGEVAAAFFFWPSRVARMNFSNWRCTWGEAWSCTSLLSPDSSAASRSRPWPTASGNWRNGEFVDVHWHHLRIGLLGHASSGVPGPGRRGPTPPRIPPPPDIAPNSMRTSHRHLRRLHVAEVGVHARRIVGHHPPLLRGSTLGRHAGLPGAQRAHPVVLLVQLAPLVECLVEGGEGSGSLPWSHPLVSSPGAERKRGTATPCAKPWPPSMHMTFCRRPSVYELHLGIGAGHDAPTSWMWRHRPRSLHAAITRNLGTQRMRHVALQTLHRPKRNVPCSRLHRVPMCRRPCKWAAVLRFEVPGHGPFMHREIPRMETDG